MVPNLYYHNHKADIHGHEKKIEYAYEVSKCHELCHEHLGKTAAKISRATAKGDKCLQYEMILN